MAGHLAASKPFVSLVSIDEHLLALLREGGAIPLLHGLNLNSHVVDEDL